MLCFPFSLKERNYLESERELVGWFGQVTPQTHYLYRNYPCLAVFARSVMQCIRFTNEPDNNDLRD